MYPVESYDTPASEGIHEFATAHPAHHIDLCTMSSTAGYDMTHFYTGHQQGVFADLSPPITQNDGYVLPQFGAEYTFEYSSGFATGSPALNAENDSSFFNNASNQLLSPAPSSSPPFAAEHKKRKNSREHAPSDQHLHNDPLVQTSHRGNKRVKLSGSPRPALLPQRHKLKFTAEDDALLVDLKETHSYTWKQIAAYFPGRSSGTLQVRYCTRLKAQSEMWNDETVSCFRSYASKSFSQQRSFRGGRSVPISFPHEPKRLIHVYIGQKAQGCNTGIREQSLEDHRFASRSW
jgi:hypothetical protein